VLFLYRKSCNIFTYDIFAAQSAFAQELEEAVAKATKEQEAIDLQKLSELEEKHRQEITGLLSESGIGEYYDLS